MQDDSVHKPELPGVRTLEKDSGEEGADYRFGGIELTMPNTKNTPTDDTATHKGGTISGGKPVFDVERAFSEEGIQEGTIVTDRKRKHTSAATMLKSAWGEWWGNTRYSVEKKVGQMDFLKPKEVPKVETVEKRASIIQEAAQYAKQAPRDDHSIIVEKVRTYAHDAETATGKPFTIKEPAKNIGAHWSKPKEEEQKPEPEKPVPAPLVETVPVPDEVKRTSAPLGTYAPKITAPIKTVPSPTVVQTEKPSIASLRTPEKMHAKKPASQAHSGWSFFKDEQVKPVDLREKITARKDVVVPRVETPSTPIAPRVREAIPERVVKEEIPQPPIEPIVPERIEVEERVPTPNPVIAPEALPVSVPQVEPATQIGILDILSRIPRSLIILTIVVVGGGLGILTALIVLRSADTPTEISTTPVTLATYIKTDTNIPVPLGSARTVLYEVIDREMQIEHGSFVQYYPTITEGEVTTPAPADAIMRTLAYEIPGSFVRALSPHMMIGAIRKERYEPFIILQSSNFDVAFAGMLSWETKMATDLSPLFGTAPQNTLFTDALAQNRSIRILRDENGKEHIVYAFFNKNLIIITTSTESLGALIERIP